MRFSDLSSDVSSSDLVARRNTTVGTFLMVCTLPRASVEEGVSGGIVASTNFKTNLEDAAFLYVGPETRKGDFFGPGIVQPVMSLKGKIGRASSRARGCRFSSISVVAGSLKKKY